MFQRINSDNTREVLFEKIQSYYYKTIHQIECVEQCMIKNRAMIGSASCVECVHNRGFDYEKRFIICSKLSKALLK